MTVATINARSIKNKDTLLFDHLRQFDVDIGCLTETWLKDSDSAWLMTSALNHGGYMITPVNRDQQKGGGVALVSKRCYTVKSLPTPATTTTECAIFEVSKGNISTKFIIIYRPPGVSTITAFTDYICDLLEEHIDTPNLFITGDFNIHINDISDNDAYLFKTSMESMGLSQHVQHPTHSSGNILDLFYSTDESKLKVGMCDPTTLISDHKSVITELSLHKPKPKTKSIKIRKIKSVPDTEWLDAFNPDNINLNSNLSDVCTDLNTELQ